MDFEKSAKGATEHHPQAVTHRHSHRSAAGALTSRMAAPYFVLIARKACSSFFAAWQIRNGDEEGRYTREPG